MKIWHAANKYIQSKRIERAQLLYIHNKSIKQIAEKVDWKTCPILPESLKSYREEPLGFSGKKCKYRPQVHNGILYDEKFTIPT